MFNCDCPSVTEAFGASLENVKLHKYEIKLSETSIFNKDGVFTNNTVSTDCGLINMKCPHSTETCTD